jgi:transaldolase
MVKIPATDAGIPAIQEAISNEININVTLIFSLERYQQVIGAWLGGLKQLGDRGGNIANVTSVASFFVSRVDTLVDKLLDEKIKQTNDDQKRTLESLKGKAAVANARQAYQIFEKLSLNPAFKALEAKGARLQRPLWASTSSKNPAYRDVMYVEKLIGPHTVNTMPLKTMEAFKDHGEIKPTISENPNESKQILDSLERAGIRMQVVGEELEKEGVRLFSDSYAKVVESIGRKRERIGAI